MLILLSRSRLLGSRMRLASSFCVHGPLSPGRTGPPILIRCTLRNFLSPYQQTISEKTVETPVTAPKPQFTSSIKLLRFIP